MMALLRCFALVGSLALMPEDLGFFHYLQKLLFQYQKQHKTILNQYFSNTIPIQKQFKTILNQDFANTIPVRKAI